MFQKCVVLLLYHLRFVVSVCRLLPLLHILLLLLLLCFVVVAYFVSIKIDILFVLSEHTCADLDGGGELVYDGWVGWVFCCG